MKELKEKGITLIALVVTIIIMLILVGVTLNVALSDNGLFTQTRMAVEEHSHATVKEALELKNSKFQMQKLLEQKESTLIEFLLEEQIITKKEEAKYEINVVKLVGNKLNTGNGSNYKDVYMLEEVINEAQISKIASKEMIKLADTYSMQKEYNIKYYGKKEGEIRDLGILEDAVSKESENEKLGDITIALPEINDLDYSGFEVNPEELINKDYIINHTTGYKISSEQITVSCESQIKDAGDYPIIITIKHPQYYNAEKQCLNESKYELNLKIKPVGLMVSTGAAEKCYDEYPLTSSDIEVVGLVNGETATFYCTGTITERGSTDNTFEVRWDGTAKEKNYYIEYISLGTLTIV